MVAHDWGGLLMWQFLAEFPEHVERAGTCFKSII